MALRAPDGGARNLWTRIASAAVMAPVAIGATWAGSPWFDLMVLAACAAMAWEWARICGYGRLRGPVDWVFVTFVVSVIVLEIAGLPTWLLLAMVTALTVAWLLVERLRGGRDAGWRVVGLVLVSLACVSLLALRGGDAAGLHAVVWVFLVTWSVDTGGYLVGRLVGGPRLAPRISPKKTWSGLIGGLVSAIAVGAAYAYGVSAMTVMQSAAAALVVGIAAVLGDLFESAAKRRFRLKDSSALIPGHGGLLDRVDGLLLAVPAAILVLSESWTWG